MSATIRWLPIPMDKGKRVSCGAPSALIDLLARAFQGGSGPWTLGTEDLPVLRGMRVATQFGADGLQELIAAIETHGEIKVWTEW